MTAAKKLTGAPGAVVLTPGPGLAGPTQLSLFGDVVALAPRRSRPRARPLPLPVVVRAEQMPLPLGRVVLAMHPDLFRATGGLCLVQQDECQERDCRRYLGGGPKPFRGAVFGCSLAVEMAFPHGLPPVDVAYLDGITESLSQRTEHEAYGKVRVGMQREANREFEGRQRAKHKAAEEKARRGYRRVV